MSSGRCGCTLADDDGDDDVHECEQPVHGFTPLCSGSVTDRRGFVVTWPNAVVYLAAGAVVLGFVAWCVIRMFRGR